MKSSKKNPCCDAGAVVAFRAMHPVLPSLVLPSLAWVEIPVFACCCFLSAPLFSGFQSPPCLYLSPFLETPLAYEEACPVKESTSLAPAGVG